MRARWAIAAVTASFAQLLIPKLALIPSGRFEPWSIAFKLVEAQLDGLLRGNIRGMRYDQKLLWFCLQLRSIGHGRAYEYLRGTPLQPRPPPGQLTTHRRQRRTANYHTQVGPADYNLVVPSGRTLQSLHDACSEIPDEGVGTAEHVALLVRSIEAKTEMSMAELLKLNRADKKHLCRTGILTFDATKLFCGLLFSPSKHRRTGNGYVGTVTGHDASADPTRDDTATSAFLVMFVSLDGTTYEIGALFIRAEQSKFLAGELQPAIDRLREAHIDVIGACADGALVMKKTMRRLRRRAHKFGRAFFLSIDFDHTTKNLRNMLLSYIMRHLSGSGWPFSILTIRRLVWNADATVRALFEHLTLTTVMPKNRMTSKLARVLLGRLTTEAMDTVLAQNAALSDPEFFDKIGDERGSIEDCRTYCKKAAEADEHWRRGELCQAGVDAYKALVEFVDSMRGTPGDGVDDGGDGGGVDDDDDDDDEQGRGEGGVDFNNSDDDGLKALCTMFGIVLPSNFSRADAIQRLDAYVRTAGTAVSSAKACEPVASATDDEEDGIFFEDQHGEDRSEELGEEAEVSEPVSEGVSASEALPETAPSASVAGASLPAYEAPATAATGFDSDTEDEVPTAKEAKEFECDECIAAEARDRTIRGSRHRRRTDGNHDDGRDLCAAHFGQLNKEEQLAYKKVPVPPPKAAYCDKCNTRITAPRYVVPGEDSDLCLKCFDETAPAEQVKFTRLEGGAKANEGATRATTESIRMNAAFLQDLLVYVRKQDWDPAWVMLLDLSTLAVERWFGGVKQGGQSKPRVCDFIRYNLTQRRNQLLANVQLLKRWNLGPPRRGSNVSGADDSVRSDASSVVPVVPLLLPLLTRCDGNGPRRTNGFESLSEDERARHVGLARRVQLQITGEGQMRTLSAIANQSNAAPRVPCSVECTPPGVRVLPRDLLSTNLVGVKVAVYWMVPLGDRTPEMQNRHAQGTWWHGVVAAPAAEASAASGRQRGRLNVQYDGDADAVDCVDIEQEHVVLLLRRNGPKAATAS